VPGKTATINFYTLEDIRIVDLPGYGYAKVSKSEKARWAGLMEGYFADDRRLGLVVQLVDMRHAPTRDDLQMINFLIDNEFPFVIVLTKRDKLSARQQQERLKELAKELPYFEQLTILPISSTSGEGMQELREIIEEVAQSEREA
ncbi:MAG: ribosome biogenesis GTP-binding protein YihA/YsxC, partial [Oscillospiraceae bacterium]